MLSPITLVLFHFCQVVSRLSCPTSLMSHLTLLCENIFTWKKITAIWGFTWRQKFSLFHFQVGHFNTVLTNRKLVHLKGTSVWAVLYYGQQIMIHYCDRTNLKSSEAPLKEKNIHHLFIYFFNNPHLTEMFKNKHYFQTHLYKNQPPPQKKKMYPCR